MPVKAATSSGVSENLNRIPMSVQTGPLGSGPAPAGMGVVPTEVLVQDEGSGYNGSTPVPSIKP